MDHLILNIYTNFSNLSISEYSYGAKHYDINSDGFPVLVKNTESRYERILWGFYKKVK